MRSSKYNALAAGIIAVLLGILLMLPSMIKFNGIFVIRGDYVHQTITRLTTAKTMLFGGSSPLWNWKNFLGTAYTGAYSVLYSFNAVCMLFPAKLMPFAAMLALCIRWFVMGVSSYAFLRRFTALHESALIGVILYCFSGYALASLEFVAFYNSMAVFPLLLLAIEKRFTDEDYRFLLIPAVVVNLLASSYLFIGSSIAMLIYALCRFFTAEEWRKNRRFGMIMICLVEYMIGVLICGFALFNFASTMFSTSRATTALASSEAARGAFGSLIIPKYFFDELAGIFLPAASNKVTTFYSYNTWFSMQAYLPVFGFSLCFASFLKNRFRDGLNIALFAMLLFSFFPILNNITSFYGNGYTRWWYALTLIMSLITVRAYDGIEDELWRKPMRRGLALQWAAVILTPVLFYAVKMLSGSGNSFINRIIAVFFLHDYKFGFAEDIFRVFSVGFGVLFTAALTLILICKKRGRFALPLIFALTAVYAMGFVALNDCDAPVFDKLLNLKNNDGKDAVTLKDTVEKYYIEDKEVNGGSYTYRVDFSPEVINYSAVINIPSICFFESTIDSDAIRFASFAGMGTESGVSFKPADGDNALRTLLSVKYYYDLFPGKSAGQVPDGFAFKETGSSGDVYENENYLPFGFAYDSYITEDELFADESACTGELLHTLVVSEADAKLVSEYLPHCEDASIDLDSDVSARHRCVSSGFEGDPSGFIADFTCDKDEVVFFSVPFDEGWQAAIDGEPCEFFRANLGFVALVVPKGDHTVEFVYKNSSMLPGLLCTGAGVLCAAAYAAVSLARRRKKAEKAQAA